MAAMSSVSFGVPEKISFSFHVGDASSLDREIKADTSFL